MKRFLFINALFTAYMVGMYVLGSVVLREFQGMMFFTVISCLVFALLSGIEIFLMSDAPDNTTADKA